jgi:hypothetical protein
MRRQLTDLWFGKMLAKKTHENESRIKVGRINKLAALTYENILLRRPRAELPELRDILRNNHH